MNGEYALNADSLENATNGNRLVHSLTTLFDDDAFITLSSLFAAFADFDEHFDRVSHVELGDVGLEERLLNFCNYLVHGSTLGFSDTLRIRHYNRADQITCRVLIVSH